MTTNFDLLELYMVCNYLLELFLILLKLVFVGIVDHGDNDLIFSIPGLENNLM